MFKWLHNLFAERRRVFYVPEGSIGIPGPMHWDDGGIVTHNHIRSLIVCPRELVECPDDARYLTPGVYDEYTLRRIE